MKKSPSNVSTKSSTFVSVLSSPHKIKRYKFHPQTNTGKRKQSKFSRNSDVKSIKTYCTEFETVSKLKGFGKSDEEVDRVFPTESQLRNFPVEELIKLDRITYKTNESKQSLSAI